MKTYTTIKGFQRVETLWRGAGAGAPATQLVIAIGLSFCLLALQGCGATTTAGMVTAGSAATGALIGHTASKKNPYWTAGGAAAGVAVGSLVNYKLHQHLHQARQAGYDQAMTQSVKQHYWMLQNFQRQSEATEERPFSYYPIVRPEQTVDGVTFKESTEYIPLYEAP